MKRAHVLKGKWKRKDLKKILNETVISITIEVPHENTSYVVMSATPYEMYLIAKYKGGYEESMGLVSVHGNPVWLKFRVRGVNNNNDCHTSNY